VALRFEPTRNQKIALSGACALLASGTAAAVTKLVGKRVFDLPWLGLSVTSGVAGAAVRWLTFAPSVTLHQRDFFKEDDRRRKVRFEGSASNAKWSLEVTTSFCWDSNRDRARWASAVLSREGMLNRIQDTKFGQEVAVYEVGDVFHTDHPVFLSLVEVWGAVGEAKGEITIETPKIADWHHQLGNALADAKLWNIRQEVILVARAMRSAPPDHPFSLSVVGLKGGVAKVKGETPLKALLDGFELEPQQAVLYDGVNLGELPGDLMLWEVGIDGTAPLEIRQKKS